MKNLYFLLWVLLQLGVLQSQAQALVLSRVIDSKSQNPVPGATVRIQGTESIATTNHAGYFQMEMSLSDTLVVEHDDYQSGMIKVPGLSGFKILLESNVNSNWIKVDSETEKGFVDAIYKIGVWEYYDEPGVLALKVDYESNEMIFLAKDSTDYVIEMNGKWRSTALDVYPRYLGSMKKYYTILQSHIKYPRSAYKKKITGKMYLSFEIDTTGQLINPEVINDIGNGCGKTVVNAITEMPNNWTIARLNGKKYKSKFVIPFVFRIVEDGKEIKTRRKKNSSRKRAPKARKLEENCDHSI